MSRTAKVWKVFPHTHAPERCFRLPVGGLLDLKDRTGLDPDDIVKKFCPEDEADENELFVDLIEDADLQNLIYTVLQVSLEWGGTSAGEAENLIRELRNSRGGISQFPLVLEILKAALTATEEDPFPKYPKKLGAKTEADDNPGGSVWRQYYRFAGATGLDPQALGHMSLWQYAQYAYGKFESTATLDSDAITEDEENALHALLDQFEGVTITEEAPSPDGD